METKYKDLESVYVNNMSVNRNVTFQKTKICFFSLSFDLNVISIFKLFV